MAQAAKWFALGALYRKEQANDRLAALFPNVSASQWDSVVRQSRQDAVAGRPRAQLLLGALHSEGLGVAKDAKAAVHWLRAAARQGNTKAQWRLGYIYYNGLGVRRDDRLAFRMFWQAAWKNDTHSQIMLGECYRKGRGAAKNLNEAEKWYRRVAERGSPPAQAMLAEMLSRKRGTGRSPAQAALWALLAVAQGAAGAEERWGNLRRALTEDEEKAVRWRALRRWPSLSWKNPLASLERLLEAVNECLPPGHARVVESALIGIWTPAVRGLAVARKPDSEGLIP
jgi:TPR repeat protein